ncbi:MULTISPECIES: FliA/WhiG family RNA polymerase sigma factor [Exiguobacterium]|uniref:FliA/WhiG family RNA polymerase sigma factor n=1 Tax=Exiguobacterium TaxID=33986 RepID=UPI000DF831D0|nr:MULTISPECIES: FliA/WhiG family RNA polymerase sigma factor [Exiguobacterium]MCT4791571.1 FliA/WhiG family RNA polymerase sigma factor [Exiguobacterium artemiae]QNR21448.1 FliA/WhiG family RNA polymerase sigma factor [Exiguobacterium sp. Helios]RDB33806.1 FliA/WhiG family RNA polymerase sigma factor [Exiguobacterium sp. RIT594]
MREELQQLWNQWLSTRDVAVADQLLLNYEPLVHYHVQRLSATLPKSVDRDELKSLGMMGLYDALQKFDQNHNNKFDTYAAFRIRGAILDGLRKIDWLPRSLREKSKRVEAAVEILEQSLQRTPTIDEVSSIVDMNPEEVKTALAESYFANILSIDEAVTLQDEGKAMAVSYLDPDAATPEDTLLMRELISKLAEEVEQLSEKEQYVVSLFYFEELTLTEIGEVLGLSTSRISQIHSKALRKLKQALGSAYLSDRVAM